MLTYISDPQPVVAGYPVNVVLAEAQMECSQGFGVLDPNLTQRLRAVASSLQVTPGDRARALSFLCRML